MTPKLIKKKSFKQQEPVHDLARILDNLDDNGFRAP